MMPLSNAHTVMVTQRQVHSQSPIRRRGKSRKVSPPIAWSRSTDWTVKIRKNLGFVPMWLNDYRRAINSDSITIDGVPVAALAARVGTA